MKLHKMGDVFKSTIDAKQKMPSYGSLNSASGHKMPGSSNSSFDHSKYISLYLSHTYYIR